MNDKEIKKERYLRRMEEEFGGELNTTFTHSTSYHRFFEGYSEIMVPIKGRRRNKIIRKYIGNFYYRLCSDKRWLVIKIQYRALYLTAVLLYFFAASREIPGNSVWYVAFPGSVSSVWMLMLLTDLFSCLSKKREMTVYDYKSSFKRLTWLCPVTSGCLLLTAAAMFVFLILNERSWVEWGTGGMFVAAACFVFLIGQMERRAKYNEKAGNSQPDPNGVIIE